MWGGDVLVRQRPAPAWELVLQGSVVRGRDRRSEEWLFQMPSDRATFSLGWRSRGGLGRLELQGWVQAVRVQDRFPVGMDFTTPPAGYALVGLHARYSLPLSKGGVDIGLRGGNLLNTTYRDYLDRFRYYADARGTDVAVWVTWRFSNTNHRNASHPSPVELPN
jgi:iron complex outermembrane receptor protein